jgi:integrase
LKIRYTTLPSQALENIRDIFLLACYTGVRSQDYHKLNNLNRIFGNMLKVRTEKTDEEVIIPLHPIAEYILAKYNGKPRIITNQKFNTYIKEVCKLAGINEDTTLSRTVGGKRIATTKPKYECVSSHSARRSFATNAYKAGVPTLAIMAITGHRTEKVFLKYVKVTKQEHALLSSVHPFFKSVE